MLAAPYHHGNVRTAMLERAVEVVEERGVEGLTLRQLARDIGVSHGTPSRHFRDKQALLDALALDGFSMMNTRLSAVAESDGEYRDRILALANAYVEFAVDHPVLLSIMHAKKHHEDASEQLFAAGRSGMEIAVDILRDAQAAGIVKDGDPAEFAMASFAGVHGVAMLGTNGLLDGMTLPVALSTTVALLWAGLTTAS